MWSKSKLKTWLRQHNFKPVHSNWRTVIQYGGVVRRNGRLYRFRDNQHEFVGGDKRWTVDVSCLIPDFDRWANSTDEHAVPLEEFALRIECAKGERNAD